MTTPALGRTVGTLTTSAATVTLLLALVACSSTAARDVQTSHEPMRAPTTSSAGHSSADEAESTAVAAYRGMWQSMARADQTADWQSPQLAKYATGDALGVISRSLYTDHINGVVSTGAPVLHPRVTKVDPLRNPTTVMISDCGDSTNWLKHKQDGSSLNDVGGHRSITAEVKKQADGSWRVTAFAVEGLGSC